MDLHAFFFTRPGAGNILRADAFDTPTNIQSQQNRNYHPKKVFAALSRAFGKSDRTFCSAGSGQFYIKLYSPLGNSGYGARKPASVIVVPRQRFEATFPSNAAKKQHLRDPRIRREEFYREAPPSLPLLNLTARQLTKGVVPHPT
jgi:hypothetical protein